jgi:hypothetical protein
MGPDAAVRVGPETETRTPVDSATAILARSAVLPGTAFRAGPSVIHGGMLL